MGPPHGRPRGPAWLRGPLPRGRALCASCASRGPPRALPRGLSAASHSCSGLARHVLARRSSRSPCQHLQVINPLFRDFSKEKNQIKNQIKIRKRHKLHKFINLNVELFFNPNFLHWITNSFIFNIMSFKIYFQRRNQNELELTQLIS